MTEHCGNNSCRCQDTRTAVKPHTAVGKPRLLRRDAAVTVVVPCFNEEASLPLLHEKLDRLEESLAARYDVEFLLVDDGSTDGTRQALREEFCDNPNCRVLWHAENRGLAAAIMTGIRFARAETVCSIDSDCSYDPQQLPHMIPLLTDSVDLVTASPYHPLGSVVGVSWWRLGLSRAASLLYRIALRQKLYTYTSCFRVYRRSAVVDTELQHEGFVGIAELLWQLDRRGSKIVEYPAVLRTRQQGRSNMRLAPAALGHLKLLARVLRDRRRARHRRLPRPSVFAKPQDEASRPRSLP